MRVIIAILAAFSAGWLQSNAKAESNFHTILWKNPSGRVVYEGRYRISFHGKLPILRLVESYRYGPFVYRCMAPERIDHGNRIFIRHYLPQPRLCHVPAGYKVCLQPAFVKHGPINVLPYLYLGAMHRPCQTAHPDLRQPVFYRPAPLIPVGR